MSRLGWPARTVNGAGDVIRAASAADTVGARALLVHAKDGDAKAFYEAFGFDPNSSGPYHLLLNMKDLQRRLTKQA